MCVIYLFIKVQKLCVSTVNKIKCMHEHENIYLFNYRDKISATLRAAFGIDFTKKGPDLQKSKILGETKK